MRWFWLILVLGCSDPTPVAPAPPAQAPSADKTAQAKAAAVPTTPAPTAKASKSTGPKLDWAALSAADRRCADCHPAETDAWRASAMGRTFRPIADAEKVPFETPGAASHARSGFLYQHHAGTFTERAGRQSETRKATHVVGSGTYVHTLLWADEHRAHQIPMSWYSSKAGWDLSPGYDTLPEPMGFGREVGAGCFFCHTNPPKTVGGGEFIFESVPTDAFSCSRCHGDGRAHAEGQAAGRKTPIIRPDTLPPETSAEICSQCHLAGAARVIRDGMSLADYIPGRPLADVVAIFVRRAPGAGLGPVDHGSRLAMSACAKGSKKLTCATCHSPHEPGAVGRHASSGCVKCHTPSDAQGHAAMCSGAGTQDCAGCHMDTGPKRNIPHSSAVDHYIQRRPAPRPPITNDSEMLWIAHPTAEPTDPDHQILLGRAYVDAWRAEALPADAERGERWLKAGLAALPDRGDGWLDLAVMYARQRREAEAAQAAEKAFRLRPHDRRAAVLAAGGRLANGDAAAALKAIEVGLKSALSADLLVLRSSALVALGRHDEAVAAADAARRLEPSNSEAWLATAMLALQKGDLDTAASALKTATDWAPQDLRPWLQLGRVQAIRKAWPESLRAFNSALSRAADDPVARSLVLLGQAEAHLALGTPQKASEILDALMATGERPPQGPSLMGRTQLALGQLPQARQLLDLAVKMNATDKVAWQALAEVARRQGDGATAAAAGARAAQLP